MNNQNPEFARKAQQLRDIRRVADEIDPEFGPRASAPGRWGWLTTLVLGGIGYSSALPNWWTLGIAVAGGLAVRAAFLRFGKRPKEATPQLEALLLAYDPVDKFAYRSLQSDVAASDFTKGKVERWLKSEHVALATAYGVLDLESRAKNEDADPVDDATKLRQLKRLRRTFDCMILGKIGIGPGLFCAMAWGSPVLAGLAAIAYFDVAPGREWWLLPQILCLLAMVLHGCISNLPKTWSLWVQAQLDVYSPLCKSEYDALLSCVAVHGWQVHDLRRWIHWEEFEFSEKYQRRGASDSPFVQKQV